MVEIKRIIRTFNKFTMLIPETSSGNPVIQYTKKGTSQMADAFFKSG